MCVRSNLFPRDVYRGDRGYATPRVPVWSNASRLLLRAWCAGAVVVACLLRLGSDSISRSAVQRRH